jgi:hypothetical protein
MPFAALNGPQRWIRKEKRFVPYRTPAAISSATITYDNVQHTLLGNRISIHQTDKTDTCFLYHTYTYIFNGKEMSGRWYNTLFSLNTLRNITTTNNTIHVHLDNYEDDDDVTIGAADIAIVFSPKGVRSIAKHVSALSSQQQNDI